VSIGRLGSSELIMHSILCGNLSSNAGALLPGLRMVTSSRIAFESASVGILQPREGKWCARSLLKPDMAAWWPCRRNCLSNSDLCDLLLRYDRY
jgi:hypothetical protein